MIRLSAFSDEAAESLAGQIAALHRSGIAMTDVRGIDGVNVGDMTVKAARSHARALSDAGIKVWAIGSPVGKCDVFEADSAIADGLERVMDVADEFGCDKIRIFSFFNAYGERERVTDLLGMLVEAAARRGKALYHENEKEIYGDSAERVIELLSRVKGLKSIYDPANYVQVGEDARAAYETAGKRADFYHVKDVVRATGEIVPAGMGDGGIREMISGISGDAVLTLEPHLMEFKGYAGIDGTELKNKMIFTDNAQAFAYAADALCALLGECGYVRRGDGFEKAKKGELGA